MRNLILLLAVAATNQVWLSAAEISLESLIPKDKWIETGITKLSPQEQNRLASQIIRLLPAGSGETGVAVIAPSVSTSMMARQVLMKSKVSEVGFRRADQILVVVRSSLYNPLMPGYGSICELQRDAENQLNIAGPNYHIYVYSMDDNLRVTQSAHQSFPAD